MAKTPATEPEYTGPRGGAYSTEEHLKAQQEQESAITGEPLHPEVVGDGDGAGKHDAKKDAATTQ